MTSSHKNLLADPTLENLFLAEEMFNFITENIDQTRTGLCFTLKVINLTPEVSELKFFNKGYYRAK
jgi:hypothetical protein